MTSPMSAQELYGSFIRAATDSSAFADAQKMVCGEVSSASNGT